MSQSHRFVTLFYSDFDPRTRRRCQRCPQSAFDLACSATLHQSSGRPGLLIGLQPEAEYGAVPVLEPGDVLLYYTDGVTEAPGLTVIALMRRA